MTPSSQIFAVTDPLPDGCRLAVFDPYRVTKAQIAQTIALATRAGGSRGSPRPSGTPILVTMCREAQAWPGRDLEVVVHEAPGEAAGSPEAALHNRLLGLSVGRLVVRSFDRRLVDWNAFAALEPRIQVCFFAKGGGLVKLPEEASGAPFLQDVQNQARLAIMTFVEASNYGAILQAYALQTFMRRLGLNADLVAYSCPHIAWTAAAIKRTGLYARDWREFAVKLWRLWLDMRRNRSFRRFKQTKLKQTRRFFTMSDLQPLNDLYAGFVAGSDQVFSIRCSNLDTAYFLGFVKDNAKKFTYAASFGFSEIPAPFETLYRALLASFSRFSMREQGGRAIIRKLLDRESEVHVDPTLLLGQSDWEAIVPAARRRMPRRYILVYTVYEPVGLFEQALDLARATGCGIVYLGFDFFWIRKALRRRDISVVYTAGPEAFVAYMARATYVLTNSFHGAVFSILFRKPFLVELENKGLFNHRARDLLDMLQLNDRVLNGPATEAIDAPVDWARCDAVLNRERAAAAAYLKSLIT